VLEKTEEETVETFKKVQSGLTILLETEAYNALLRLVDGQTATVICELEEHLYDLRKASNDIAFWLRFHA